MKVDLDLNKRTCTITREPGDTRFSGRINAAGESRLLHHVKKELIRQGHDVIKKRMWRDGHIVDDLQQYIRSRKIKPGAFALWSPHFAIEGLDERLMRTGTCELLVEDIYRVPIRSDPAEVTSLEVLK